MTRQRPTCTFHDETAAELLLHAVYSTSTRQTWWHGLVQTSTRRPKKHPPRICLCWLSIECSWMCPARASQQAQNSRPWCRIAPVQFSVFSILYVLSTVRTLRSRGLVVVDCHFNSPCIDRARNCCNSHLALVRLPQRKLYLIACVLLSALEVGFIYAMFLHACVVHLARGAFESCSMRAWRLSASGLITLCGALFCWITATGLQWLLSFLWFSSELSDLHFMF